MRFVVYQFGGSNFQQSRADWSFKHVADYSLLQTAELPSIEEIEYGYRLADDVSLRITYRAFGKQEISLTSLQGWKTLKKLFIRYYMVQKEPAFISNLPLDYDIERNVKAQILQKTDKLGNKKLIISLNMMQNKVYLYPSVIQRFAEETYNKIDNDIQKIFNGANKVQVIMSSLLENLKRNKNLPNVIATFKKSQHYNLDQKLCNVFLEETNLNEILYLSGKKRRISLYQTDDEDDEVDSIIENTPPMKKKKIRSEITKKKLIFDSFDELSE